MLYRFLGINPGEKSKIFLFALLSFCWSIASSTGVALSDALFLEHVGSDSLAYTFAITAVGMFALSGLLMYLYNRLEIDQIFWRALAVAGIFYFATFILIVLGVTHPAFWVLFKVCSYFFQIGFLSLFFTYLDQFFEMQNAKTVFSLLYSPVFLGMAVSGAILSLSSTKLGMIGILTLILVALAVALFLLTIIPRKVEKIVDDHQEFSVIKTGNRDLLRTIFSSKFTLLFLCASIMLQTVLVITEFEYMAGLENAFMGQSPLKLTEFLGKLYLWGSLVNIFFGLFFYGRIVKKIGLNNIILIVPVFFTALFAGWSYSSHIVLPILGFMSVEGVITLLEDNNFNLLLNAVPLKLKNKIRITCESLLEPIGMLVSSLLLMAFQAHSKTLGLVLSLIFLVFTVLMRAYYTKGIFHNLVAHLIPFQRRQNILKSRVSKNEFKKSYSLFLNQFSDMKYKEQLFVIELALKFHDLAFLEKILKKVTKMSWRLKLKTLELFEDYSSEITVQYLPYFQFWMKQHPHLENDFFFHLSKMKLLDPEVAQEHLKHPNAKIRGACLLTIRQKIPRSFESKQARKILYELLISENEEDNLIAIQILKYDRLKDFKSKVFDLLHQASFPLKKHILKTLAYLLDEQDSQYGPVLLGILKDPDYSSVRLEVIEVLRKVSDPFLIKELLIHSYSFTKSEKRSLFQLIEEMGTGAIPELESIFQNKHLPDRIRLISAQLLSKLSPRHLKIYFNKIVKQEIERAFFYYYHLHLTYSGLNVKYHKKLKVALKNSYDSAFAFLIQTLALIQRFDQSEYLVHSLQSKHPKTYSHALETLEKMCPSQIFKSILPIIEHGSLDHFLKVYQELNLPILTIDNLLDYLQQTPSYINQAIVPLLRQQLRLQDYALSTEHSSHPLHQFTLKLLEVS